MTAVAARPVTEADVRLALDKVSDPELDEPITDLGFVQAVTVTDERIEIRLRLPTSFCSPNFAYLMAADAKDAVTALGAAGKVVVELDDHHDSDLINRGLAADAGYRGTFAHEAEDSLDELRLTFQRKAHTAAMERALTLTLNSGLGWDEAGAGAITIGDVPAGPEKQALISRRGALGFGVADDEPVLVESDGRPVPAEQAVLRLRQARSVRISVDGNAHFCRGLLRTRYPGSGDDQVPRADETRPALPLLTSKASSS